MLFGRSGVTPATWGPVKSRESGLPLRALRALCGSSLRSDSDFLAGKRNEPRSTQRAQRKGMTHPGQVSRPPVCLRLKSGWSKTSRTIPTLLSLRQDCPRFAIASGICSLLDGTSGLALGSFCQNQPRAVVMRSRNSREEIALWFVLLCEWGRIVTAIFQEKETIMIMIHQNTLRGIVAVSPLSPAVVVDRAC